jgi:hypothetical protein
MVPSSAVTLDALGGWKNRRGAWPALIPGDEEQT